MKNKKLFFVLSFVILFSCKNEFEEAEKSIKYTDLERHIRVLASDEFEGRKPFTQGEEKTVEYIKNEFEKIGLVPAYNNSYYQNVPVVEIKTKLSTEINIKTEKGKYNLNLLDEVLVSTNQLVDEIKITESELIFAGYGIVAPEYGWNDYKGLDVKGKTVVILVNDPGLATEEQSLFKGSAMTYYGRWTYKYEEAARQGAEGVIIVHQDKPAGYPWSVLKNGYGIKFSLQNANKNLDKCKFEGWITLDMAKELFAKVGRSFEEMEKLALDKKFQAVPLNASISFTLENQFIEKNTKNVIGLYPGTDKKEEVIVFLAHWDHLGIGRPVNADSIYNGSADNAAAVAWMLEIAEAFTSNKIKTSRSILFISPTTEEFGMLGSNYYVENPIFPMEKTIAVFNTDVLPHIGSMKDLTITGFGQSTLDEYVGEVAKEYNRYTMPDPDAHNGMYFRSDHFCFAKKGVPSFFAKGCSDHITKGKEYAREKMTDYWQNVYHQPSDEYNPKVSDLNGLLDDAKLFFKVAYKLSNDNYYPQWKEDSEFKSARGIK